jgi:hypothetical protein
MKGNVFAAFLICLIVGCGNLSPRQDQEFNNQGGKIDEIKNNQNGVMAELGTLKNQAEIQNSELEKIQQGMLNLQSNYENNGVQVFSGPGGLIVSILALMCGTIILLHYRNVAKIQEKTANILAERIANSEDPSLEDSVFQAAMYTNVEENVLNLMKKHKKSNF